LPADITFTRAYPAAHLPMPADRGALGYIPVSAFQYCESVRVASGMGWYLFPPRTISLMFDGMETFIADEGQWRTFTHEQLEPEFQQHWNAHAPDKFHGHAPSYLRRFSEPGIVQIWTGYFVETPPDLWLHIRPVVNKNDVSGFSCYEAIVETDSFRPSALFMNLRIHRTHSEILIEKDRPLFQICAIEKSSVRRQSSTVQSIEDLSGPTQTAEGESFWTGLDKTLRIAGVTPPRQAVGAYAAETRKREKSGP
jgi:Family of unknown function (DUF6065)